MLKIAAAAAVLMALAGCSSYARITAVQRPAEAKDDFSVEIRNVDPKMPFDFRFLTEDSGVKYFAAESSDTPSPALPPINSTNLTNGSLAVVTGLQVTAR